MSITVRASTRPTLKVVFCQRIDLGRKSKLDVQKLVQSARQQGFRIDSEEVTPSSLKKRKLDADLTVINVAGLSQKTISDLDGCIEESFLQEFKVKRRGTQSRVIICDPAEIKISRQVCIELRPPPIIQALLNGKFFGALQAGFLRIEPLREKLFQGFLEVIKGREKERSIN